MPRPGAGVEWIVDVSRCRPSVLRHRARLESLFRRLVRELGLRPVGKPSWHRFPRTGGLTGAWILAESHLTIHTFPEHASCCLNLFCCSRRAGPPWKRALEGLGAGRKVRVRRVVRTYRGAGAPC